MRADLGRLTAALDGAVADAPELADALAPHRHALDELAVARRFEAAVLAKQSHTPRPLHSQDPMLLCHICAELSALYEVRGEAVPSEQVRLVPSRARRGHR